MRHRYRSRDSFPNRHTNSIQTTLEEIRQHDVRQIALSIDKSLGVETCKWCVVLMHALDGSAVGSCSGGLGHSRSPAQVRGIQNPRPVNCTHHHGSASPEEHKADGFLRIIDGFDGLDPAPAAAVSVRSGHVNSEGSYVQAAAASRDGGKHRQRG
jgi:hypothetical protein